jgi:hypothetical protein
VGAPGKVTTLDMESSTKPVRGCLGAAADPCSNGEAIG